MFRTPQLRKPTLYSVVLCALILVVAGKWPWNASQQVSAADVQVSREQFVRYIEDWSEPEGYFDTDNFISNETSYLHVIPELAKRVRPGGVYLGVGPDQNFSYIVHTRPSLAIIVDIRRQNMLELLFYKALFDLSASRAEFLSMLFAKDAPRIDRTATLPDLLRATRRAPSSDSRHQTNFAAIKRRLTTDYGLKLSAADFRKIEYVYDTFFRENLDLRFSSIGRSNALNYPTFEQILLQTDRTGRLQNYLADEESFLWLKKFQAENRLVPIVGDFAGPHAFKAAGAFLGRNGLQVSAFYTSNVEFYLFGRPEWRAFLENVRALPMSNDAVFIRAYFSSAGPVHPLSVPGHRSTTLVHDASKFLSDAAAGKIRDYWDVVNR
jgi:hypothetical protein